MGIGRSYNQSVTGSIPEAFVIRQSETCKGFEHQTESGFIRTES